MYQAIVFICFCDSGSKEQFVKPFDKVLITGLSSDQSPSVVLCDGSYHSMCAEGPSFLSLLTLEFECVRRMTPCWSEQLSQSNGEASRSQWTQWQRI